MARIKLCGFTRASDVEAAARLGVDAIGFVFADSLRQVRMGEARELIARARRANHRSPEIWGVFAHEPIDMIRQYVDFLGLDVVQLHGAFYSARDIKSIHEAEVVKGISFSGSEENMNEIQSAMDAGARAVLLDAVVEGQVGGTGRVVDWYAAAMAAARYPVVLSGGLSYRNVAEAIRRVTPEMVDASSGLEMAPGVKDPALMSMFVEAVREVS